MAKIAVTPPCMNAVPKPRTIHVPDAGVGDRTQEVQVLDHGETGADREAADRGVDQEADAMGADQHDDHRRLQELLDQRRDVARKARDVEAESA